MLNQNTPFSNPQNQGLPNIHRITQAFIRAGLSDLLCLWPSPPPAQASAVELSGTQSLQEISPLELGKPIERERSDGISHFYKITMTSGQFLRIVVEQRGVDVVSEEPHVE